MPITRHVHALKLPAPVPIAPDRFLERFVYSFVIAGVTAHLAARNTRRI